MALQFAVAKEKHSHFFRPEIDKLFDCPRVFSKMDKPYPVKIGSSSAQFQPFQFDTRRNTSCIEPVEPSKNLCI